MLDFAFFNMMFSRERERHVTYVAQARPWAIPVKDNKSHNDQLFLGGLSVCCMLPSFDDVRRTLPRPSRDGFWFSCFAATIFSVSTVPK